MDNIIKIMVNFFFLVGGFAALTLVCLLCMDVHCNWLYWPLGAVLAGVISVFQTRFNN